VHRQWDFTGFDRQNNGQQNSIATVVEKGNYHMSYSNTIFMQLL
jgi:hypothetical protein